MTKEMESPPWNPMCPRHVAAPPPLPATPRRVSLLRCILLASCCVAVMPPDDAAGDEWAAVGRQGPHLRASGRPFIVHGFNTYWLMYFAADPATRPTVTAALAEAADAGLNVCRTWAFNDGGYRALQLRPFSYDEEVFQVLAPCIVCVYGTCLMKCGSQYLLLTNKR